jgi:hypothetical protein
MKEPSRWRAASPLEGRDIFERVCISAPLQRPERSRERGIIDIEYDLTTIRLIDRHFLRGGLAPWQARHSRKLLDQHLAGNLRAL